MDANVSEWLHLIARWTHVIAAIAWIGHAFLFNEIEHALVPPEKGDPRKGLVGEMWMVHGGGFFKVEKSFAWPKHLRGELTWFKWEAAMTWLSGLALLILIFWSGGGIYLIDPTVADLALWQAISVSVGTLVLGWVVYSILCRTSLLGKPLPFGLVYGSFIVFMGWALTNLLSGRAAFLHVGAMIATVMGANVWMVIIPRMKRMVADAKKSGMLDVALSYQAKQRSLHNNYFVYPVIFLMLSNHFPSIYGHPHAWVLLALVALLGASVKHVMNVRGDGMGPRLALLAAVLGAFILAGYNRMPQGEEAPIEPLVAGETQVIDVSQGVELTGIVQFTGVVPPLEELRLFNGCESGVTEPLYADTFLVSEDGGVKNAFVWIEDGWQQWTIPAAPENAIDINQQQCIYDPHVTGVRVGQTVRYLNSDALPHNVRTLSDSNATFNEMMLQGAAPVEKVFRRPEVMVQAKCDIHPWMAGYVGVVPHPWFATTSDDGSFSMAGVPPGTYTVNVWHEELGLLSQGLTIAPSTDTSTDFFFGEQ
ncbi:MAG: putative membrane protein/plastocyanin [Myxococcota bacterium]